jgi:hypothetical protein
MRACICRLGYKGRNSAPFRFCSRSKAQGEHKLRVVSARLQSNVLGQRVKLAIHGNKRASG